LGFGSRRERRRKGAWVFLGFYFVLFIFLTSLSAPGSLPLKGQKSEGSTREEEEGGGG